MEKNYASAFNDAKLMISGIKANSDKLGSRELNAAYASELESIYNDAQRIDNEQESLKAKLKTKTEELDSTMTKLNKLIADSKKNNKDRY